MMIATPVTAKLRVCPVGQTVPDCDVVRYNIRPETDHSHVRHFKLQARIFLACPPSCSAQPPLGKAGGTIMKRRLIML